MLAVISEIFGVRYATCEAGRQAGRQFARVQVLRSTTFSPTHPLAKSISRPNRSSLKHLSMPLFSFLPRPITWKSQSRNWSVMNLPVWDIFAHLSKHSITTDYGGRSNQLNITSVETSRSLLVICQEVDLTQVTRQFIHLKHGKHEVQSSPSPSPSGRPCPGVGRGWNFCPLESGRLWKRGRPWQGGGNKSRQNWDGASLDTYIILSVIKYGLLKLFSRALTLDRCITT